MGSIEEVGCTDFQKIVHGLRFTITVSGGWIENQVFYCCSIGNDARFAGMQRRRSEDYVSAGNYEPAAHKPGNNNDSYR
jgi:hypothetical protein